MEVALSWTHTRTCGTKPVIDFVDDEDIDGAVSGKTNDVVQNAQLTRPVNGQSAANEQSTGPMNGPMNRAQLTKQSSERLKEKQQPAQSPRKEGATNPKYKYLPPLSFFFFFFFHRTLLYKPEQQEARQSGEPRRGADHLRLGEFLCV